MLPVVNTLRYTLDEVDLSVKSLESSTFTYVPKPCLILPVDSNLVFAKSCGSKSGNKADSARYYSGSEPRLKSDFQYFSAASK